MKNLELGAKVKVIAKYHRYASYSKGQQRKEWYDLALKKPKEGIFLGTRTLRNGYLVSDCEGSHYFVADETIKVALVCTGKNKNPFYAIIEE